MENKTLTDNEVYITVLTDLLKVATEKKFIDDMNSIIEGLKGKDHVEEQDRPQYKSVLLWGRNIFPFSIKEYRKMAEQIIKDRES